MLAAGATATVMIAFQMGAKATRDALFLSSFDVSSLPAMVIGAAVVSVGLSVGASRTMTAVGPARVIPWLFALSAALLLFEWWLIPSFRRPVAVLVYLHFSGLGAIVISGFWSLINERYDPRTAKRQIGRIAAAGTVGGLLGGLLAERVAALLTATAMLPALAGLHILCALLVLGIGRPEGSHLPGAGGGTAAGARTLTSTDYLRGVVALVVLTTIAEVLIDYVFKARASGRYANGESLLRFFAAFYTGTAAVTVVMQALGSKFVLERLGPGRSVALLPAAAAGGGLLALVLPQFGTIVTARGAEAVTRNGLYRGSYELLFAPLAPAQKRATKPLVDVGMVRLGDVIGAAAVQFAIVTLAAGAVTGVLLGLVITVSAAAAVMALRLQGGYVRALGQSLVDRAGQLSDEEAREQANRTAFLQTVGALGISIPDVNPAWLRDLRASTGPDDAEPAAGGETRDEPSAADQLRSRDPTAVRAVLALRPFPQPLVEHAIPLLAWDDVAKSVIEALRHTTRPPTRQLVERLLDPDAEFAVRRRIPVILALRPSQEAVDGLLAALGDPRFEVRYRSGLALSRSLTEDPSLSVDSVRVLAAVQGEVEVDRGVWQSHRLLDRLDDEAWSPIMDQTLRDRADRSLEHVFTMLALLLPKQPLKLAFMGLHTDDPYLRGTALEYLESALPDEIREPLWPFLDDPRVKRKRPASAKAVLDELLQSKTSIMVNLAALRRAAQDDQA